MTLYDPTPDKVLPVALLGEDYPGLRIKLVVEKGDVVAVGQTLFHDAKRPEIAFVSSIQGRVTAIQFGPRRTLSAVVLDPIENGPQAPADRLTEDSSLRTYLLARGAWPAFVARPFGGPPNPDARPDAIVVSAVPSSREGFAPHEVLLGREAEFARGLQALISLTDGPVHLCVEHGLLLSNPERTRIRVHARRATRGWRTASGQVAQVCPTGTLGQVWTTGYQDVIAIGHLLETGTYDPIRCIALRRSITRETSTMRVPLGADLGHVFAAANDPVPTTECVSGTAQNGRRAAYLGRHHDEVGSSRRKSRPATSAPQPLIPFAGLNRVLPARVPAVPLMRALSIGDAQACAKLGCLELLEEDVACLSAICTSGTDYGRCLRDVLDQLRKEAA